MLSCLKPHVMIKILMKIQGEPILYNALSIRYNESYLPLYTIWILNTSSPFVHHYWTSGRFCKILTSQENWLMRQRKSDNCMMSIFKCLKFSSPCQYLQSSTTIGFQK